MIKYIILGAFLIMTIVSCHSKKSNPKKDPYKAETFFDEFKTIRFPFSVTDSVIESRAENTNIPIDILKKYLPDTVMHKLLEDRTVVHPVGKIDNATNRFIIVSLQKSKNTTWYVFAFDNANKFLSYMQLIRSQYNDSYRHSLSINQEPTFTLSKNKKDSKDNLLYTNEGYGYNAAAKQFSLVINDTNENLPESDKIYIPIDTLLRTFPFSGNYEKNKQNILVIRDGARPNEYQFFYHFDKTDDDANAKGEIKGKLKMVNENSGIYQQGGDPCVIYFTFKNDKLKINEEGNCANYRGSNVQFDETFSKRHIDSKKENENKKKK